MITYQFIDTQILNEETTASDLGQIIALYREAGWWEGGLENYPLLIRIINGSHCFMVARCNTEIVGMGRAISDHISDAYIQDVTVKKNWRQQGVATAIVECLITRLQADGLPWIALIAENGAHLLYERLGFQRMAGAIPLLLGHGV